MWKPAGTGFFGLWSLRHAHQEMLTGSLVGVSLGVLGAAVVVVSAIRSLCVTECVNPFEVAAFIGLCAAFCWPLYHALSAAVLFLLRNRPPVQIFLASIAGALFAALPFSAIVMALPALFWPQIEMGITWIGLYTGMAVIVLAFGGVVHYVACQRVLLKHAANQAANKGASGGEAVPALETDLAESAGDVSDARLRQGSRVNPRVEETAECYSVPERASNSSTADAPVGQATNSLRNRLFSQLPQRIGRDIVYVTVSGHYINVVTTAGSTLILMRLVDATAALGDMGMRVHRSHWVALRHVAGVLRRDGRMLLRLTNDIEVPVSRSHMVAVSAAVADSEDERRSALDA